MEMRRTRPSRLFFVNGGGAGVNPDVPCDHGTAAISLHLFSTHSGLPEDLGVLLPQCLAPDLFGAALAAIQVDQGKEAADKFVAGMLAARDKGLPRIAEFQAKHRTSSSN